ncbi:MAG: type II toxin-antitoxin system VapC family toxin [Candidatus Hydrothermarchaeales archaeon]
MIYLDTNAFYLFFFENEKYTPGIKKILSRIQLGEEEGMTSCITLDELAYVVLMRLIEKTYRKHPSQVLRESPEAILEFVPKIRQMFDIIFSFKNLRVVECDRDLVGVIPILMERMLLPRDCIHLQTMIDHGCNEILTTDLHFDGIADIRRIRPEDV